jgi:putative transcriptional regulator
MTLEAHLLAASPHMDDTNFARAVVLMIQHDDAGAFGLVLNHPSEHSMEEVWQRVGEGKCALHQPLNLGGPVEGPLVALHDDAALAEREILPGVFFASQRGALEQLVEFPAGPVRLFSGYSGWGGGQLEEEVRVGAWLALPASSELVFFDGDDLWKTVAGRIGGEILQNSGIKHMSPKPWMN